MIRYVLGMSSGLAFAAGTYLTACYWLAHVPGSSTNVVMATATVIGSAAAFIVGACIPADSDEPGDPENASLATVTSAPAAEHRGSRRGILRGLR